MERMVPISEARGKLHELAVEAAEHPVVLCRHGRPAVVMLSPERYDELLERIEDLEGVVSVYESKASPADLRVPLEKVKAELGLD